MGNLTKELIEQYESKISISNWLLFNELEEEINNMVSKCIDKENNSPFQTPV